MSGNQDTFDLNDLPDNDGKPDKTKLGAALLFLKGSIPEEKYSEIAKHLELDDTPNAEVMAVLNEIKEMLSKNAAPEGEGEGNPESFKDFMAKCMAEEGATMPECSKKYKEKYPDTPPSKEEEAEVATLHTPTGDVPDPRIASLESQLKELKDELTTVKDKTALGDLTESVEDLKKAGHIAPAQVDTVVKLAAQMPPGLQKEYLDGFRSQKFKGFKDEGKVHNSPPGEVDFTEEDRIRIIKEQRLGDVLSGSMNVPDIVKKATGGNS